MDTTFTPKGIFAYDDNKNTIMLTSLDSENINMIVNNSEPINIKKVNLLDYARLFTQFHQDGFYK